LRFKEITVRGLPSEVAFGIPQTEIWNPNIHRNATIYPGMFLPNGTIALKTQPDLR
jgi:hypothetical protein